MPNRTKRFAISIFLLVSFLIPTISVAAQDNLNDWSRLNAVAVGSKLSVKLKDGKTVEGNLNSVSDVLLTMTVKSASMELRRDEVVTVHQLTKKSATKSTLIGLGVGAGIGAVVGVAADATSGTGGGFEKIDNVAAAGVTVVGAVAGTVTGFFLGRGSKRTLIYRVK